MRYSIGVTCAFVAGGIIGSIFGRIFTEEKLAAEYRESAASYRRAMELARETPLKGEKPDEEEIPTGDLTVVTGNIVDGGSARGNFDPMSADYQPSNDNPYHRAVEIVETPIDMFVAGGVNDYGISYLEEEEYEEDDGRVKTQVALVMDDANSASFFIDGKKIEDWDERLGDSILVDFYRLTEPGITQVLYVRNHKTDEDYEVLREMP